MFRLVSFSFVFRFAFRFAFRFVSFRVRSSCLSAANPVRRFHRRQCSAAGQSDCSTPPTCRISLSTHMQTHADTHTCRHPHMQTPTHCLNLHEHTHTQTHIRTDIDTRTQKPTHYLNSLDLTLHTAHSTDNSHSDILRDEKCFRATRRLVFFKNVYIMFLRIHN